MTTATKYTCDACRKSEETTSSRAPIGWVKVSITVTDLDGRTEELDVCSNCRPWNGGHSVKTLTARDAGTILMERIRTQSLAWEKELARREKARK